MALLPLLSPHQTTLSYVEQFSALSNYLHIIGDKNVFAFLRSQELFALSDRFQVPAAKASIAAVLALNVSGVATVLSPSSPIVYLYVSTHACCQC